MRTNTGWPILRDTSVGCLRDHVTSPSAVYFLVAHQSARHFFFAPFIYFFFATQNTQNKILPLGIADPKHLTLNITQHWRWYNYNTFNYADCFKTALLKNILTHVCRRRANDLSDLRESVIWDKNFFEVSVGLQWSLFYSKCIFSL